MNLLENYLLNQQNKPQTYNPSPLLTPEQFEQKKQLDEQKRVLAEKLMQPTSLMNGVQNLLIHPKNAIFGMQSNNQEVPISYNQQPIVGVDVTQQDYNNMQNQGLLPESPMMVGGIKENPRVGGLLQDFSSGFKENAQSKFNPSNFEDNTTDYGGKKGLAYRLGEGLGTAGKFMASPAGRGLMTMAGVGLTGGNPTQAMTYGLQAGLGNYNNVQQDKMNRQLLQANGIDTSNIRGYLNNDMAKSYTDNYRSLNDTRYKFASLELRDKLATVKDNTTKAKMIMDGFKSNMIDETQAVNLANMYGLSVEDLNESNQTTNTKINKELAPAKKKYYESLPVISAGNMGINAGRLNLESRKQQFKEDTFGAITPSKMPAGSATNLSSTQQGISQLSQLEKRIGSLPDRIVTPGAAQLSAFNPYDTDAQSFQQYVNAYKQVIGKGLEGGVLRKEDEIKYQKIIPKVGDTKQVLAKKSQQLRALLENKYSTDLNALEQAGYYTDGFRNSNQYSGNVPQSNNTTQRAVSKSGRPMIKVNGVWQYE